MTCRIQNPRNCRFLPVVALAVSSILGGSELLAEPDVGSVQYIEACPAGEVRRYGPAGELLEQVLLGRTPPQLVQGDNRIGFACQGPESPPPRAWVQIRSLGEPIR